MNQKVLEKLFENYIAKFDAMNTNRNDEFFKWEDVFAFQRVFDLDAEDFPAMLKEAKVISGNLIDSYMQPFGFLVVLAEKHGESERVRQMLKGLLAPSLDLVEEQERIDAFLKSCEELLDRYYPGSHMYQNDQRSAMGYLWLNDPEHHYLAKQTEAQFVAEAVEFYDDWGTYGGFKLDVFYRFCDQLRDAIAKSDLMQKSIRLRSNYAKSPMHPDENLHILVFDLIFCAYHYDLLDGAPIQKRTPAEIKDLKQKQAIASEKLEVYCQAEADMQQLYDVRNQLLGMLESGAVVTHKTFGHGTFAGEHSNTYAFSFGDQQKGFLLAAFASGILVIDHPDFNTLVSKNRTAMEKEYYYSQKMKSAAKDLEAYVEYLET